MSAEKMEPAWTVVASKALPLHHRSRGLSTETSDLHLALDQGLVPLHLLGADQAGIRSLQQVPTEPIVMVETDAPFEDSNGTVALAAAFRSDMGPQDRVLDARSGPAWVSWRTGDARVRVRLDEGMVYVEVVGQGLDLWQPPTPLQVPEADIEPALKRWAASPWLVSLVRAYSRGTPLQRATSVALFARNVTVSLDQALAEETPWTSALIGWERTPKPLREAILERAVATSDGLEHQLDDLQSLAATRHPAAAAGIRLWVWQRDDLESLSLLGQKARESGAAWESFTGALRLLDHRADAASTWLSDVKGVRDERLESLSWRDPAAWWGRLG